MTLAARLRSALGSAPTEPLFAGDDPHHPDGSRCPAAVLIAVTDRPEPGMIFTVRREEMRTHAGQIAFPGGRIESDEDAAAAAVREAHEELDLDPKRVEIVGAMESYLTITGFEVTPVLGVIPPDLSLTPHEREVADWFEAPLSFLLDPANRHRQSVLFEGVRRHYFQIEWEGQRIWGATAAMLVNLSRRLRWS